MRVCIDAGARYDFRLVVHLGEKRLDGTEFWQDRGIKTYMAENSNSIVTNRTLQNEYDYILDLGKIFDVEDKAQAIVTSIQTEVNGILEKTKGQKQKTALIIEFLGDQIHTYDATTLGGNMVTTLGGICWMRKLPWDWRI